MRNWLIIFPLMMALAAQTQAQDTRGARTASVTADTGFGTGTQYAVVIGVSNYKYIHPLNYADRDAYLFKDFLESKAGGSLREDNILSLINEQAKGDAIIRIETWLKTKKFQKGDRVYFYFAGHGDAISARLYFFLLSDCNPQGDKNNYFSNGALRMYDVKAIIADNLISQQVDVVLIWDACREGELYGGKEGLLAVQNGVAEKTEGETIMLSTSAGQAAWEDISYAHGHGLFTYYLIEGLSGAADFDKDGTVTFDELKIYLAQKVRDDAWTKFKAKQVPTFVTGAQDNMTLSRKDSSYNERWALMKETGGESVAMQNTRTRAGGVTTDSVQSRYYNELMDAIKNDSIAGDGGAERLLARMQQQYPDSPMTKEAEFNLAMEYVDVAQQKVGLYLSGKDGPITVRILQSGKDESSNSQNLTKKVVKTIGVTYATTASYVQKTIDFLNKTGSHDSLIYRQLTGLRSFLLARSFVSGEGVVKEIGQAKRFTYQAIKLNPEASYNYHLLALLFDEAGQYDSAKQMERKAIAMAPNWIYPLYDLGNVYYDARNYDSAEYFYKEAARTNPTYQNAYTGLGNVYDVEDKHDLAKWAYKESIRIDPTDDNIINALASVYYDVNQFDSARYFYRQSLRINSKSQAALNGLGIMYSDEKKPDSALVYYEAALKVDPKYWCPYNNIGVILYNKGNYDSARWYYLQAMRYHSNGAVMYSNLGGICEHYKSYDSAKNYYRAAIKLDRKLRVAWSGLGIVYNDLLQYDSAKPCFLLATQLEPTSYSSWNGLGNDYYYGEKKYDSAIWYYKEAIRLNPLLDVTHNSLGGVYYDQNKYDSAFVYYNKALQLNPKLEDAWYGVGNVYYVQGKYDSARRYYAVARQLNPDEYLFNGLGNLFYDINQNDSARWSYFQSLRRNPTYQSAYNGMGNTYYYEGHYDTALLYYRVAIQLNSKYYLAYENYGNVLRVGPRHDLDSAKWYYRVALGLHPDVFGCRGMANTYLDQENWDSAKYYFQRLMAIGPTDMLTYNKIGNIFCDHSTRYDSARWYYFKALQLDPKNAALHYDLGLAYRNSKNRDSAIWYFAKSVQLDPDYGRAIYQLGTQYYFSGNHYDSAIRYMRKSLLLYPGSTELYGYLGSVYCDVKSYDSAKRYLLKAVAADDSDNNSYYNLACIHSLRRNNDSALYYYKLSLATGFKDFDHIAVDTDLDHIRNLPDFIALTEEYRKKLAKKP